MWLDALVRQATGLPIASFGAPTHCREGTLRSFEARIRREFGVPWCLIWRFQPDWQSPPYSLYLRWLCAVRVWGAAIDCCTYCRLSLSSDYCQTRPTGFQVRSCSAPLIRSSANSMICSMANWYSSGTLVSRPARSMNLVQLVWRLEPRSASAVHQRACSVDQRRVDSRCPGSSPQRLHDPNRRITCSPAARRQLTSHHPL